MRLWPRGERRTLETPGLVQPTYVYAPFQGVWVNPNTALATPTVWSCVRVLADAASSCPLLMYRRLPDDSRRRVGGRTAELLQRPAEGTTQADLIATLMAHLTLWGNAYLGKYRDQDGRVDQLLPLDPSQVQVERRAGRIVFSVVTVDGHLVELGLDDVIHIKALSNDGLVGLSPITQMRTALVLDDSVRTASTSLFTNNGRPSGVLTGPRLSQDQADRIKETWNSRLGGDQAGAIAVVTGNLEFTPLSMHADDAQYVEARKLSATEIARCFRIPPWLIGAGDDSSMTYSNTESQMIAFTTLSLQPWLRSIEQALTNDPDLFSTNQYCEFLIDALLRADSRTRAEVYAMALDPQKGWMTRDEVRRAENLPPEQEPLIPIPATNGEGAFA
jgi:HK97 family phage portal protein